MTGPEAFGGQTHEVSGPITEWPAAALADLLGVPRPDLAGGEPLPLGWHWLYLLDHARQGDLGADGHPVRGVFPAPPAPGLRRMWAGGALTRARGLRMGEEATRRSRVVDRATKRGRSGTLVFVQVEHELRQGGELALRERQDIVYRDLPATGQRQEVGNHRAEDDALLQPEDWSVAVSPTMLFRFSALTYNSHRIHYDRDYARTVEGYPGLVIHGPLQALLMAEHVRARNGVDLQRPATFEYRLIAPLFEHQGLVIRTRSVDEIGAEADTLETEACDRRGRRTAQGTYRPL